MPPLTGRAHFLRADSLSDSQPSVTDFAVFSQLQTRIYEQVELCAVCEQCAVVKRSPRFEFCTAFGIHHSFEFGHLFELGIVLAHESKCAIFEPRVLDHPVKLNAVHDLHVFLVAKPSHTLHNRAVLDFPSSAELGILELGRTCQFRFVRAYNIEHRIACGPLEHSVGYRIFERGDFEYSFIVKSSRTLELCDFVDPRPAD
ncbi:hypothetical protein EW026_g3030 [Hermanssonia centrifuga]|uniref:Uncharacterized protein n=1 Tax=Hermanssonia centrifuga TaxID=98765 RepID=A0A4V3XAS7_9APHY|nr:hypothetical protein EW026_g3030 [Hermanssonia centrifuga]